MYTTKSFKIIVCFKPADKQLHANNKALTQLGMTASSSRDHTGDIYPRWYAMKCCMYRVRFNTRKLIFW